MGEKNYYTPYSIDLSSLNDNEIEIYLSRINQLPALINEILSQPETAEYLEDDLGPNFNLTENQIEELARIVRDLLIADLFLGDLTMLISQKLKVSQNISTGVANKLITELFAPVLEDIKKMQREKFADRLAAQAQNKPVAQPPAKTVSKPETLAAAPNPQSVIDQIKQTQHQSANIPAEVNQNNVINLRKSQ